MKKQPYINNNLIDSECVTQLFAARLICASSEARKQLLLETNCYVFNEEKSAARLQRVFFQLKGKINKPFLIRLSNVRDSSPELRVLAPNAT